MIGIVAAVAIVTLLVVTVLHRENYTSMLPLQGTGTTAPALEAELPVEVPDSLAASVVPADSLAAVQPAVEAVGEDAAEPAE